MKAPIRLTLAVAALTAVTVAVTSVALLAAWPASAQTAEVAAGVDPDAMRWGFASAALAAGLAALGAGYAVANVGTAGLGTLAEKPDLFGRVLVMVGLAEGIAIYGLIVSILILNRLG
jgi:V/A-type H+/Na+-transporting ATPase subunit K